ncbi:MAG: 30S ribosomal protein S16 [Flavobacteriales bacterium]|nr:30S ribosomal protein S16 [Flavobacteriales bacterium]
MATKIRLARHGKKGHAYFHIVVADSRSKRDGKYIERLGAYNPNTNPATIEVNFNSALDWIKKGAEPTNTARAILSYTGVMMKNHLDNGVLKGAHTQEQADAKFEKWVADKAGKIDSKKVNLTKEADAAAQKALALEKATNEKRAAEIAARELKELTGEEVAVETEGETEAPVAEAETEAPVAEAEAPAEEASKEEEKPAE